MGQALTYIALLRGINVGGHTVKMERLRELFEELGLTNVRSYIQTGNIFFETEETDRALLTESIERHLHQALGYEVLTFLRTIEELEQLLELDPFEGMEVTPDMRLCVTFVADPILDDLALPLYSPKRDIQIVHATKHEAFVVWYIIGGKPPGGQFLDKTVGRRTTTRFFHTTAKILKAAKNK